MEDKNETSLFSIITEDGKDGDRGFITADDLEDIRHNYAMGTLSDVDDDYDVVIEEIIADALYVKVRRVYRQPVH